MPRTRAILGPLFIAAAILAGCVAPAGDTALPSSLDVDLREYVLNITMPTG